MSPAEKGHFPQKKKGPGIVLKTTAAIAGGAAVVGGAVGGMDALNVGPFAGSSPDQGTHDALPDGMPSTTATATQITESPTPITTAEPTPSLGYHEGTDGISFTTEKGEVLNVPQIDGLKASLQTAEDGQQKVIYTALEQNPYGMSPEEYAGEYKPNVDYNLKQTGAVVLRSPVTSKLIENKLNISEEKWAVALPLDIRNYDRTDYNIAVVFSKGYGDYEFPMVKIVFGGELSLTNIIPGSQTVKVLANGYYKWLYYIGGGVRTKPIVPGNEMDYITVTGPLIGFTDNGREINAAFGDVIANTNSPINVTVQGIDSDNNGFKAFSIDQTKILSVESNAGEQVPVFLASNTP
ncbi:MAG: hypothetical protein HYT08_04500 [Candidatus Levybacteria bacterium]|nr:hypothetical protein [Candidatus Levybacteria bacterium]